MINGAGFKTGGRLKFQIAPRKRRDGFTLKSAVLSFPVWYETLNEAVSYARFIGRDLGCEICINDSKGNLIDEIKIDENSVRQPDGLRLTKFTARRDSRISQRRRGTSISGTYQFTALEAA